MANQNEISIVTEQRDKHPISWSNQICCKQEPYYDPSKPNSLNIQKITFTELNAADAWLDRNCTYNADTGAGAFKHVPSAQLLATGETVPRLAANNNLNSGDREKERRALRRSEQEQTLNPCSARAIRNADVGNRKQAGRGGGAGGRN